MGAAGSVSPKHEASVRVWAQECHVPSTQAAVPACPPGANMAKGLRHASLLRLDADSTPFSRQPLLIN